MKNINKANETLTETKVLSIFKFLLVIFFIFFLLSFSLAQSGLANCNWDTSIGCDTAGSEACACNYRGPLTNPTTECSAACDRSEAPTACESTGCNCSNNYKIDEVEDIIAPTVESYNNSDLDGSLNVTIDNFYWKEGDELIGFDWTSNTKVCAIVVKGASGASGGGVNIYQYANGSTGDTCLVSPKKNSNTLYAISHITFCYPSADNSITVRKVTSNEPSEDTDFEFSKNNESFTLTVHDFGTMAEKTFTGLTPDTYTISETPPDLWYLNDIIITGDEDSDSTIDNNSVDVNLDSGEHITVTFENKKLEITIIGEPGLTITQKNDGAGKFSLRYDGEDGSKGTFDSEITLKVEYGDEDYRIGATYDSNAAEKEDELLELVDSNEDNYLLDHYSGTVKPAYADVAQLGALDGDEEDFQLNIDLAKLSGSYTSKEELKFELSFWLYPPS